VAPESRTFVLVNPVIAWLNLKVSKIESFGPTDAGPARFEVSADEASVVKVNPSEVVVTPEPRGEFLADATA
jgi:hypothetical protein